MASYQCQRLQSWTRGFWPQENGRFVFLSKDTIIRVPFDPYITLRANRLLRFWRHSKCYSVLSRCGWSKFRTYNARRRLLSTNELRYFYDIPDECLQVRIFSMIQPTGYLKLQPRQFDTTECDASCFSNDGGQLKLI
jgi:hypothetical protein